MGKTACKRKPKPKPSEEERRAWPRLSEIPNIRHPAYCQNCSRSEQETTLDYWQEHDHNDVPERIVVVLCRSCGNALIQPHPRLYRLIYEHTPWPGLMPLCRNCYWRTGTKCRHANNPLRGGKGLQITQQSPAHFSMRPRSQSGPMWFEAATDCEGLHTAPRKEA